MEKTEDAGKNRERFIPMPGLNRFSERLKIAMNGMSNVALAGKCGISESAVRSYIKGKSYPGIDKIQAIADACEAPMIWLITGEGIAKLNDNDASYADSGAELVLGIMSSEQKQNLIKAVIEHGVSGIMSALNGMADVADFLQLTENERAQVLRVYGQIREGASERDQEAALGGPMTDERQAG